VGHAPPRE